MLKKIILTIFLFFGVLWFSSEWFTATWKTNLASEEFEIKVFELTWTKSTLKWDDAKETINNTLWIIIQKLMVAMWILSLLIMTIGSGYMIMYHGQDELLSKWKSIFSSGLIALAVALSSYYLVSLVRLILYTQ
jgi:hypothetical protein